MSSFILSNVLPEYTHVVNGNMSHPWDLTSQRVVCL